MSDPYETTEAHLDRLLGRALNSFDLPDRLVERLGSALAHSSSLYSSHHSAITGLERETFRHTYLLADGEAVSLWELAYRSAGPDPLRHEVFGAKAELSLALNRLFGDEFDAPAAELEFHGGLDEDDPEHDIAVLGALFAREAAVPEQRRVYAVDDSADHARRVLRRAENADRPGADTARLLRSAYAHQITQAFGGRQCLADGRGAGFTLYEHAFVLMDGREVSLWEVEHTATPDGRHMCEVYAAEAAAREAMELRARVR
ncbi:DUF6227 family protein [Streptomyces sp. NPDC002073]